VVGFITLFDLGHQSVNHLERVAPSIYILASHKPSSAYVAMAQYRSSRCSSAGVTIGVSTAYRTSAFPEVMAIRELLDIFKR
jgi:hypothetical protein